MLFRKKGRAGGIVCHTDGCGYRREADSDTGSGAAGGGEKSGTRSAGAEKKPTASRSRAADDGNVPEPPEGFESDRAPTPGDDDAPF